MKDSQKGFVVPLLTVIIALLVIGGGSYVYLQKKSELPQTNTNSDGLNTFTHSNGVFSFQYPSSLIISEHPEPLALIYRPKNSNEVSLIYFFQYFKNGTYGNKKVVFKRTTPKGYKVYTFGSAYMISLEDNNDPSYFLSVGGIDQNGLTDKELWSILNSISIDREKAVKLINKSESAKTDEFSDTAVKFTLPKMQNETAAPYYIKHNSYSGLCESAEFATLIRPITTPTWSKVSSSEISCFSSPTTWSVSAPLFAPLRIPPGIKGYCVDSTGFAGDVLSSTIGLTGKCE